MPRKTKRPYEGTRVPLSRSISEAVDLLRKAGVDGIRTTEGTHTKRGRMLMLEFSWPDHENMTELPVMFELLLDDTDEHDNRRRGRFLFWLIKCKVENIEHGFRTALQEFVGELVISPGMTLNQQVEGQIATGHKLGALKLLSGRK